MGIVPEEEKYSVGRVVRLEIKSFLKSAAAATVKNETHCDVVLRRFLEAVYIDHDMAPKDMDSSDFSKIVLETLPKRFTPDEEYLSLVPPMVRAYMDYLTAATNIPEFAEMEKTLEELDSGFIRLVESVGPGDRIDDEPPAPQIVRPATKVGRNDPCPCGSGKKYKKCCIGKE